MSSIPKLKCRYKCPIGFSDHTVDHVASIVAISLGATIIEKHFKMDTDKKSVDNHFSTNISNYRKLKIDLENSKKSLGQIKEIIKASKEEKNQRRSLYVSKNLNKNDKLNMSNIKSVRPGFSLHPKYLKKILGKKIKIDLEIGSRMKLKYLKWKSLKIKLAYLI